MKRKTKIFATTLVCLIICVVLGLVGMKVYADGKGNTIPNGVYIETLSLGGKTTDEAQELVDEYVKDLSKKEFTLIIDGNEETSTLGNLGLMYLENTYIQEAYNFGKTGNLIKRYKELKDIEKEPVTYHLEFTLDKDKVTNFITENGSKYEVKPVNAKLTRKDGAFKIEKEVLGRTINIEDTIAKMDSLLTENWDHESLSVDAVMADAEPDVTSKMLKRCKDVLGEYNTNYASSSSSRAANLDNAARLINGSLLMPGEIFSTSEKLVPFTAANGYETAGAYLNGKVVDSIGGGVCQAATTLYNALLKAELEITERFPHSMIVSYVEPSMDAAISDGYKDLKFKNNTEAPIYVEAYTVGRNIYFKIYGEETRDTQNRKIEYKSEVMQTIQPGADIETKDPTLPVGYRRVEQSAHIGYKAQLWKYVYVNGEQVSKEQVNYSSYAAQPAYVVVGTKEEEKEEPNEDENDQDKEDGEDKPVSSQKPSSSTKPNATKDPGSVSKPEGVKPSQKPTPSKEPSTGSSIESDNTDSTNQSE
ncbi:MAG: VanW family protein [Clostridium sp.]|nr:VanW family protein [Clostridium sp.]